jgi:hypothetical protein
MKTTLMLSLCLVLAATACRRSTTDEKSVTKVTAASMVATPVVPSGANEATVKPFVPSHPVPPIAGAFPHRDDPAVSVANRPVDIAFVRDGGEPDVAPLFALTNRTGKTIRAGQTFIHYYDASGKLLHRSSHSLGNSLSLEPGAAKEQRLGNDTKDIPKGTASIEAEMTSGLIDGAAWQNENLSTFSTDRPRGGLTANDLVERSGERVIVDVYGLTSYRVRVTNVTDKVVQTVKLRLYYATAKGDRERIAAEEHRFEKGLAPGKSVDLTLKPSSGAERPPKALRVVGYAPDVVFADGTKFQNKNLDENRAWLGLAAK